MLNYKANWRRPTGDDWPRNRRQHITRVRTYIDWATRSELASRLASGAFWSLVGGVASQLLALVASISVARLLGSELFGQFGMIRSTAMTFGTLATFGLGLTATKHVAELRRHDPERAGRIIVLSGIFAACTGVVMAVVLYLAATPLAQRALDAPHLAGMVRVGSLLLALTAINAAQAGALAGFEAFRTMTKVNVTVGMVSVPVLVTATYVAGLPGAVWGLVGTLALQGLLNYRAVRREAAKAGTPLRYATCLREWRVLWSFSLPAALSSMLSAPAMWICHALLVNQPGGYTQMGVFNAANQWRMAILFVPQKIVMVALPVLSSLAAEGRIERFKTTLKLCVLVSAVVSIAVAAPVMALSSWIMRLYGDDFLSGTSAVSLLAVSAVFMSVSFVGGQAVISLGRAWFRLAVHVLWSAALLGSLLVLVVDGGNATSLALVNVIAYGVHCLAQYAFLARALGHFLRTLQERATPHTNAEPDRKMAA